MLVMLLSSRAHVWSAKELGAPDHVHAFGAAAKPFSRVLSRWLKLRVEARGAFLCADAERWGTPLPAKD
jgi:hypothetical protein